MAIVESRHARNNQHNSGAEAYWHWAAKYVNCEAILSNVARELAFDAANHARDVEVAALPPKRCKSSSESLASASKPQSAYEVLKHLRKRPGDPTAPDAHATLRSELLSMPDDTFARLKRIGSLTELTSAVHHSKKANTRTSTEVSLNLNRSASSSSIVSVTSVSRSASSATVDATSSAAQPSHAHPASLPREYCPGAVADVADWLSHQRMEMPRFGDDLAPRDETTSAAYPISSEILPFLSSLQILSFE